MTNENDVNDVLAAYAMSDETTALDMPPDLRVVMNDHPPTLPDVDAELGKRAEEIAGKVEREPAPWTLADFEADFRTKRDAFERAQAAYRDAQSAVIEASRDMENARVSLDNARAARAACAAEG